MHRFESQLGFILHTRPYRETSLLLELFTLHHGRMGAVAKGVRREKVLRRGLLQPFIPLLLACAGRGELLTLKAFEPAGASPLLTGRRLVCAFYLNELLVRLLHRFDPNPELFLNYHETLMELQNTSQEQKVLRLFEKSLLKSLGYELPLLKEVETGLGIEPEKFYRFDPVRGPLLASEQPMVGVMSNALFKGASLLALAAGELHQVTALSDAKRLMRLALAHHLGPKPLESGKLL